MRKIILFINIFIPTILYAQAISIEELWNIISTSTSAQQQELNTRITRENVTLERLNRYPIVYAEANVQRNLIIPTTPVPAIAFDPSAQDGAFLPLKFATRWNTKAGIQAEWQIFNPIQQSLLDEKKIKLEQALILEKSNTQELKKKTTLAYVGIVLASLQYNVAVEDSAYYHQILQTVTKRFEAGRISQEQFFLANQDYERKKIYLYESWAILKEANLELQKYVDLPDIQRLSSNMESIQRALQGFQLVNYDEELTKNESRLIENERKYLKKQLLPTLTFNAFYGAQYFNRDLNLFRSENWFGNSYANIALRLPISNHFLQHAALSKNNTENQLNRLQQAESILLDHIKKSQRMAKINAGNQKVSSIQKIIQLSEANLAVQKLDFEAGRILWSDYNRNLANHNQILKDLWQAQYDLITYYLD